MLVQLLVVLFITSFAVYATNKLQGFIKLDYSPVYVFLVIFLLLSNIWTYTSRGLQTLRNAYYPIVDIRQAPRRPLLLTGLSFVAAAAGGWGVNYLLDLFAGK
jgi:hypothetical protein